MLVDGRGGEEGEEEDDDDHGRTLGKGLLNSLGLIVGGAFRSCLIRLRSCFLVVGGER